MSFFDVPVPPPEPDPPRQPTPPWLGPPRGLLPGLSAQRAILFRDDKAILLVDHFRVYPTGLSFSLRVILKERKENHREPWGQQFGRLPYPLPDDFLRFGIQFADGWKWTNLLPDMRRPKQEPERHVITNRGTHGGDDSWKTDYWLWQLPTEGPLTFVASWPAYGVAEARATVDGAELRRCAKAAEVIWPS